MFDLIRGEKYNQCNYFQANQSYTNLGLFIDKFRWSDQSATLSIKVKIVWNQDKQQENGVYDVDQIFLHWPYMNRCEE